MIQVPTAVRCVFAVLVAASFTAGARTALARPSEAAETVAA